jgi:Protein of unknown function (DUF4238)
MSPDVLDNIKDEYHSLKKEGDPATFEEFKAEFAKNRIKVAASYVLPHLLGSKRMAKELVSLKWFTRIVAKAKFPLLTSDRPVIMTNGLKSDDAHIVLPISPRIAFVACRSEHKAAEIASMDSDFLARQINDRVALQAVKYVYGVDDNQLTFVEKRLGARLPCSPIG